MDLATHSLPVQLDVAQWTWQQSEDDSHIKKKHWFAIEDDVLGALGENCQLELNGMV